MRRAESWDDITHYVNNIIEQLRGYVIHRIVAVEKGGIIPAGLLLQAFPDAAFSSLRVTSYTLEGKKAPRLLSNPKPEWNVATTLVVDEICDSGDTFTLIQEKLPGVMYAALYVRETSKFNPEFSSAVIPSGVWIDFPWERSSEEEVSVPF